MQHTETGWTEPRGLRSSLNQPSPVLFVPEIPYLEQTILQGVDKPMDSKGGAGIPCCLDSGAGADVEHLADDVQLCQPAARQQGEREYMMM